MSINHDRILQSFQLENSVLANATKADKQAIIVRALKAAERLKDEVPEIIDPSTLPAWDPAVRNHYVGLSHISVGERDIISQMQTLFGGQPLYEVRQSMANMGHYMDSAPENLFVLQDEPEQTQSVVIFPVEARKLPGGGMLMVVAWTTNKASEGIAKASRTMEVVRDMMTAKSKVTGFNSDVDEQHLFRELLKMHQPLLDLAYNKKVRKAFKYKGMKEWEISFLLPVGSLHPTALAKLAEVHECAVCKKRARLRCGKCEVWYCTAGCQKKDWEAGHKSKCAKEEAPSLKLFFTIPTFMAVINKNDSASEIRKKQQSEPTINAPANKHGKSRFIVKIQKSLSPFHGPMMMYDERRTLQGLIMPAPSQFNRNIDKDFANATVHGENDAHDFIKIEQLIVTHGPQGLKGFFWAQRESDWSIKVFTEELPKQNDIKW